ncbi:unnamed protein product [Spodoptera exigua]|nr:unnamed protein product [Spodoptera exigua]
MQEVRGVLTGVGVVGAEVRVRRVRGRARHLLGDGLARHAHVALLGRLLRRVQRLRRAAAATQPVYCTLLRRAGHPGPAYTHVGSQLGSRIMSSGSTGSSAALASAPVAALAATLAATLAFHEDDISGEELERRTGCRDLPCKADARVPRRTRAAPAGARLTSGTMSSMSSSSVVLEELWRCGEPGMLMGCVLIRLTAALQHTHNVARASPPPPPTAGPPHSPVRGGRRPPVADGGLRATTDASCECVCAQTVPQ